MPKLDPVTGPLTRDELKTLAAAPVGAALRAIRKHDPLYGYPPGTKINWLAIFVREQEGYAYVRATSLEEAKAAANAIKHDQIEWDSHPQFRGIDPDFEFVSVEADGNA
jgi:hypothetical protein